MEAIDAGLVDQAESNSMLRNMIWTGLLPALKDVTGHLFDSILDFDSLRRSLRRVERDHNQRKTSASKEVNPAMVMTDSTYIGTNFTYIHTCDKSGPWPLSYILGEIYFILSTA